MYSSKFTLIQSFFSCLTGFCHCLVGFHAHDREQWHCYITHFSEQAIQGGLIDHRAG